MKLTHIVAALAFGAALVSAPASAGVIGMADLVVTNLKIVTDGPVNGSIMTVQKESRRGVVNTSFNDVDGTSANLLVSGIGASVDVPFSCIGPSCGSLAGAYGSLENNGTTHITAPSGDYALGDMKISGNALDGTSYGLTRADSSVSGPNNTSNSDSSIKDSVSSTVNFTISGSALTGAFSLDYNAFIAALIDANVTSNESAYASSQINWTLTLHKDGDPSGKNILLWSPEELNLGATAFDSTQNVNAGGSGSLTSDFVTLGTGSYSLTIFQSSSSVASEVPEPGSMLLVALGLLGVGVFARRRRQ